MHALEDEPEKRGQYKRFGVGLGVSVVIATGAVYAADQVSPNHRILNNVLKMAIVDDPEPPKQLDLPPPPPPPELPPPKPKPKPEKAPASATPTPEPRKDIDTPPPETVGLDPSSFGSGSGGPAFDVGSTQMGTPGTGPRGAEPELEQPKPKLVEARPIPGNPTPPYTDRARRLAIQGLMVIEADIDEKGKVTNAVVRRKLEPLLDENARKTVLAWRFEPATLAGEPVASYKYLRIRFQLD